jgi:hypothetical protein
LVTVKFDGSTNTLRLGRPPTSTADCNANFLMLVPIFAVNAMPDGTNVMLSFPTQSGFNYQVQYKNNLTDSDWNLLGSPMPGNNSMQAISDPATSARFYRVLVQ